MKKRMIIFKMGWMKNYQGEKEDDPTLGDFDYLKKMRQIGKKWGEECFTFDLHNDELYTHAPYEEVNSLHIEKLGANKDDEYVDNIIVVFCAKFPEKSTYIDGIYIVGWYENARVYKNFQKFDNLIRGNWSYNLRTRKDDGYYCVPPHERKFDLKKYLDLKQAKYYFVRDTDKKLYDDVLSYIEGEKDKFIKNKIVIRRTHIKSNTEKNENIIDFDEPKESDILLLAKNPFSSNNEEDTRIKAQVMRVLRQGQPKFRSELLNLYQGKCVISGCSVKPVLEAAHILPYFGDKSNHICNGLLLRGDIHTLFDMNYISIDSESFIISVDKLLDKSIYWEFQGKKVNFPPEIAREISYTLKKRKERIL